MAAVPNAHVNLFKNNEKVSKHQLNRRRMTWPLIG
jgi:hypothetical protein